MNLKETCGSKSNLTQDVDFIQCKKGMKRDEKLLIQTCTDKEKVTMRGR
jgi:hypothetical protein